MYSRGNRLQEDIHALRDLVKRQEAVVFAMKSMSNARVAAEKDGDSVSSRDGRRPEGDYVVDAGMRGANSYGSSTRADDAMLGGYGHRHYAVNGGETMPLDPRGASAPHMVLPQIEWYPQGHAHGQAPKLPFFPVAHTPPPPHLFSVPGQGVPVQSQPYTGPQLPYSYPSHPAGYVSSGPQSSQSDMGRGIGVPQGDGVYPYGHGHHLMHAGHGVYGSASFGVHVPATADRDVRAGHPGEQAAPTQTHTQGNLKRSSSDTLGGDHGADAKRRKQSGAGESPDRSAASALTVLAGRQAGQS
eukprot:Opistho-2@32699